MELSSKTDKQIENGKDHADTDFSKKVEESKKVIQNEINEKLAKEEKKSKVGGARPGAGRKRLSETQSRPSAQSASNQNVAPAPQTDFSIYLAPPLKAVSKIPAMKTGIPELALNDDEAMLCAKSLNEMLNVLVPDTTQMDPKTAAVLGCCVTFGSIGFQKYSIYLEKKKPIEKKIDEVQEVVAEAQAENGIPSENYFKTTRV